MLLGLMQVVADPPSSADVTQLLQYGQYGFLGAIVVCLLLRKLIVPEWVLKDAEDRHVKELAAANARADKAESQVERLQEVFQAQLIPALTRSTEAQARVTDELSRWRWSKPHDPGDPS